MGRGREDGVSLTPRRRHLVRDAGLAVAGIAAGIGLTFVPRLLDGEDAPATAPLPVTQGESVAASAPAGGPEPVLSEPGAESAVAAVEEFLAAEQRGELAASFELLSADDRRTIPSVEDWTEVHADVLPPVVAYQLGEPEATDTGVAVPAIVEFEPGLNEFSGLTAARSEVTWLAVEDDLGWRVSLAESSIEPVYPPDTGAVQAAREWLGAGAACDPKAAAGPGVTFLGLRPYLVDRLCGVDGPFDVGPVDDVDDPALISDLVAAFGPAAPTWARVVPVDGPEPVRLVLAPIGDRWAVIDVVEAQP